MSSAEIRWVAMAFVLLTLGDGGAARAADEPGCRIVVQGDAVELHSPAFVFRVRTADGLRADWWENRLTGRPLSLGNGPEVELDVGLPNQPLTTPKLRVQRKPAETGGSAGEAVFELASEDDRAAVTVTYRWDAKHAVLRKFVSITNRSGEDWDRLLNVRLGDYTPVLRAAAVPGRPHVGESLRDSQPVSERPDYVARPQQETAEPRVTDRPSHGHASVPVPRLFPTPESTLVERGFPAYVADEFFLTLAHPAGVAESAGGKVSLRQYPGTRLRAGGTFGCMEAVYGVAPPEDPRSAPAGHSDPRSAPAGQRARAAFLNHLTSRMRRVVRGHDRPYAIFEPFGARPGGNFDETEAFVLDNIAKVAEGQRQTGLRFDTYSVDFWVDYRGTLKECNPQRFPHGLTRIQEELAKLGTPLGLWIDSSWDLWSIGGNPQVQGCLNVDPQRPETVSQVSWGRKSFCRATEPIRSMYVDAFRHHIREHGVRLVKFDNLANVCYNPAHAHLPGVYSTEPIMDAVSEFLQALDRECPDVFLMLYWGYRSPWWLLHGDTLFDSGLDIEAASPSTLPAPYARNSVTHKLDQAQWHASDVPALGKDSLGVWLSDWGWNSQIGKERWQEGFLMDVCRGSLLAQPWSDTPWLSPPERAQIADFIALVRAQPGCFRNPRFVVGNPQRDEPYGYCCSDGRRAFVALHNCSWKDHALRLLLKPEWGLPAGQAWDLYRWYPSPARLRGSEPAFPDTAVIALRPFEVALIEIVPAGQKPSLDRAFEQRPIPTSFPCASRDVEVTAHRVQPSPPATDAGQWTVLKPSSAVSAGGATLTLQDDGSVLASGQTPSPDKYTLTTDSALTGITGLRLEALPDERLPGHGPGRAVNGNFALTEIRVRAFPRGKPDQAAAVPLHNPRAEFAQVSHGGWPVTAALDGDTKTGWSIDPEEGQPHEAVFETPKPVGFENGTALVVELDQGDRGHSLGRFRLSATTARPVPAPQRQRQRLLVQGRTPSAPEGGLLVVTLEMSRAGKPLELPNVGSLFSAEGTLAGRPVPWQAVWAERTYPSCWQAWRLPLAPTPQPQDFELTVIPKVSPSVSLRCAAHFIPR